jgi:hypothetical protein
MKRLNTGICIVFCAVLFISLGCASSGSTSQSSDRIGSAYNTSYWTLEDFLRRANGVQLITEGSNIRVLIRGNNSIGNPDSQPLFVVDGQKAGRNFNNVSSMFSRGDIISVRVLPAGASSQYGMQGNYGVIEIESRNAANRKSAS